MKLNLKEIEKFFGNLSLAHKVGLGILTIFCAVLSVVIGLFLIQLKLKENLDQKISSINKIINDLQELRAEHIRWKVNLLTNLLNEDYEGIGPDKTVDKLRSFRRTEFFEVDAQIWNTMESDSAKMNEIVLVMKKAKAQEEVHALYNQFQEYSKRFLWEGLEKMIEAYYGLLDTKKQEVKRWDRIFLGIYLALFFIVLSIILFGSSFIGKRLKREINKALFASRQIARGDFRTSLDIERRDEIGYIFRALEEIRVSFNEIILNIKELSDEIKPVVESFKSLGETSSAKSMFIEMRIEEVLMEVEGILKDLEEQSHLISQMKVAVDEINKTVLYTSNIANHAMEQAAETQKLISTLEKASSEVESIVKFIREVAEQTNLLALNASIEAARAGEVGKGFAVVANEVKELARQTDQAGIEITKKINAIQNLHTNIIKTVESMISTFKEVKDYANIVASAVEEQTITLANIESQAQIHKERAELTSRAFHDLKEEYKSMSEDIQKNINFSLKLEEMSQKLLSSVEHFQTFKIDRRDLRRIRLGEETEFVYNQSQYKGVIKDISAGGAYILTNYKPDLHSNIKVKFKTELSWLEFEGTVVRVDKQGFALRWVKIDQESLLKLKGFLSQYYSPDLLEKEIEKFQKTSLI